MKKISFYIFALVAMVAAACSSDDAAFEAGSESQGEGVKMTLLASVDDNKGEGTRSTFTEGYEDSEGKWVDFQWAAGDKINVFTNFGNSSEFTLDEESDGQGNGKFSGTLPQYEKIGSIAYYPYDGSLLTTDFTDRTLSAEKGSTFTKHTPNTYAPLYGTIENGMISFKYLTGVVKVTLKNVPAGADRFKFMAPGKNITGLFTVETGDDGERVMKVTDGDENSTVTHSFGYFSEAQNMVFYVPLPVGTYDKGFRIEVWNERNNLIFTKTSATPKTINRADVMAMKVLDVADFEGYELNGTEFTVYTARGLQTVNEIVNNDFTTYASYNITLANDITLTAPAEGESNWTPIGNGKSYNGTFDGNGNSITGLHIHDTSTSTDARTALIGYMYQGTVKNLTLIGCNITGPDIAAAIVGNCGNRSTIENCTVKSTEGHDVSISRYGDRNCYIGGIIGKCNGKIINCTVECEGNSSFNINSTQNTLTFNADDVGGIVGYYDGSYGYSITACLARNINLNGENFVAGGIAGSINNILNYSSNPIIGSYAYMCTTNGTTLSGEANIFGEKTDYDTVIHCYYTTDGGTTFGHAGGDDANTDWTSIVSAMNGTLESYGLAWVGEADDPKVTAAE